MLRQAQYTIRSARPLVNALHGRNLLCPTARGARKFTVNHLRLIDQDDASKSKVNYYEQLFPWSSSKQSADSEYPFLDNAAAGEARRLKAETAQLEEELKVLKKQAEDGSFLAPLLQMLPREERERYERNLRESKIEEARDAKATKALLPQIEIQPSEFPSGKKWVHSLNVNLKKVLLGENTFKARSDLWQSYLRCRSFSRSSISNIPYAAWALLFNVSVISEVKRDLQWASHRITLYEDMSLSAKKPNSSQQILYVNALRQEGRQEEAMIHWQSIGDKIKDDRTALAHHELSGVALFCAQKDPARAEQIAFQYLQREEPEESRILIGILALWLERGDDVGAKHAWTLYVSMKAQLGSSITMQDYDNASLAFLNGGRTDLALAIFKDMMLTNQDTGDDSLDLWKKAIGFLAKTQEMRFNVDDINTIALTTLAVVPRRHQNRFFYGSWLKKLISMKATDAAAQVIDLMYERGVKPDPKHLNGIIGAWMRSDEPENHQKGEDMALAMISERLHFVNERDGAGDSVLVGRLSKQLLPSLGARGKFAAANIETLSLLLNYYVNRRFRDKTDALSKIPAIAKIQPDHFFMNHLLFDELLEGRLDLVWTKYMETFSDTDPDLETFECLWDAEKQYLDRLYVDPSNEFPDQRTILYEMTKWFSAQKSKQRVAASRDFDRELYGRVIRCFCLSNDYEGLVPALYFFRDAFQMFPNAATAKIIIFSAARMFRSSGDRHGMAGWKPRRHRIRGNESLQAAITELVDVHNNLWDERRQSGQVHGSGDGNVPKELQNEEGLFTLVNLIRFVIGRMKPESKEDNLEEGFKDAALSVGFDGPYLLEPPFLHGEVKELGHPKGSP